MVFHLFAYNSHITAWKAIRIQEPKRQFLKRHIGTAKVAVIQILSSLMKLYPICRMKNEVLWSYKEATITKNCEMNNKIINISGSWSTLTQCHYRHHYHHHPYDHHHYHIIIIYHIIYTYLTGWIACFFLASVFLN